MSADGKEENKDSVYTTGIEAQVEVYKKLFPELYRKAQKRGEEIMKTNFQPEMGKDTEGDKLRAEILLKTVKMYDFGDEELLETEKELLCSVYGENWREKNI